MSEVEWIAIESPALFVIDEVTFKVVIAGQFTDRDPTEEIYGVLCKAMLDYTSKRNMSLGYSQITCSKRKEI